MVDKSCELLFEYLRSILYDESISELNIEELDEPFRKLGKGLSFLHTAVEEMLEYSAELSRGNLSAPQPERDNFLCANLKNMHATLNHLTWQAQQVALGDYSQKVSYLGEFSTAFNTMTEQLREREERLVHKAEIIERRSKAIEEYNELLVKLTSNLSEWILVVDAENREIVYCNKPIPEESCIGSLSSSAIEHFLNNKAKVINWSGDIPEVWELTTFNKRYLRVDSQSIDWHGYKSYIHIITDITKEKLEKKQLSAKAYTDPVTAIHNRLYFEEYMEGVIAEGRLVTLAYIDLDGLKYVNDSYGHSEGDGYITYFSSLIRRNFRRDDVFARIGGDEFCLVLEGDRCDMTVNKLEKIRDELINDKSKGYPMSFSYGVRRLDAADGNISLEAVISEADAGMYEYKRENKRARN